MSRQLGNIKLDVIKLQKMFSEAVIAQAIIAPSRMSGKEAFIDEWAKHKQAVEARYSTTRKGKDVAMKKEDKTPDPTMPVAGTELKYLIWYRDYGAWIKNVSLGTTNDIQLAYRFTLDEITAQGYQKHMVPDSNGSAALVAVPSPEWHEALTCAVFDEEAGEFLSYLGQDAGDMQWTSEEALALAMTLADARTALERVRKAYLEDDSEMDVSNFRVTVSDGPVPDEVLTFVTTKKSALYNAEGVEAAAKKVEEAFAKNTKHYTGSYNADDPVDEFTDALGQHLYDVHTPDKCEGDCPIHGDSMHHMNTWPLVWNPKDRTFMRQCEHGRLHPDPDDKRVNEDPLLGQHECCDFVCCVNLSESADLVSAENPF
jgi:hypothetical protein